MNSPDEHGKVAIPDGKGGWQDAPLRKPRTKVTSDEGKRQQAMQEVQEKDFFERVGACTESLNQYLEIYSKDHGLDKEEVIAAIYLELLNNLEFYPEELGGKKRVEAICKDVNSYFQRHKNDVPRQ